MPRDFHVTLTCCGRAKGLPAVVLNCEVRDDGTLSTPLWVAFAWNLNYAAAYASAPASFCPYCGTQVPGVRWREVPLTPLWTGDADRCTTCHERNHACECYPPEAAWEAGTQK